MRGLVAVAMAVVAACLLAPAAGAALVVRDDVDSADVTFTADPGEANRVVVREEPGGFRFVDTGSALRTSTCTLVNDQEVFCPGIAETLEWTAALVALDRDALDEAIIEETLGVVLKYQDDVEKVQGPVVTAMLDRVRAGV